MDNYTVTDAYFTSLEADRIPFLKKFLYDTKGYYGFSRYAFYSFENRVDKDDILV